MNDIATDGVSMATRFSWTNGLTWARVQTWKWIWKFLDIWARVWSVSTPQDSKETII
jgi:hypothetical protein